LANRKWLFFHVFFLTPPPLALSSSSSFSTPSSFGFSSPVSLLIFFSFFFSISRYITEELTLTDWNPLVSLSRLSLPSLSLSVPHPPISETDQG